MAKGAWLVQLREERMLLRAWLTDYFNAKEELEQEGLAEPDRQRIKEQMQEASKKLRDLKYLPAGVKAYLDLEEGEIQADGAYYEKLKEDMEQSVLTILMSLQS